MPQIIFTAQANDDMHYCWQFLAENATEKIADKAFQTLLDAIGQLASSPKLGRYYNDERSLRELIVRFGKSGYQVLYRLDNTADHVRIIGIRHSKQATYRHLKTSAIRRK